MNCMGKFILKKLLVIMIKFHLYEHTGKYDKDIVTLANQYTQIDTNG